MTSQTKQHVLLLVHRIPFPPDKGDKITTYHLLRHLTKTYQVHTGYFIDDGQDQKYIGNVDALCASTFHAVLHPMRAKLKSLAGLLLRYPRCPLTLDYYHSRSMQKWVDNTIARNKINQIVVYSSGMAQYVEHHPNARRIIDFADIDSDKWRQYAQQKSWPLSWVYQREGTLLLHYERQIAALFDYSLFITREESDLFKRLAPESADKIDYVSNGVDTDYFSPEVDLPSPFAPTSKNIVFTGAMDYWPNCDAVAWFAQQILPLVRQRHPEAQFYIVGARPGKSVTALAALEGVTVTGTVPDVRPYLRYAHVAVAPLRIARGIQNKVLEAMSMAKTVVVSPEALEGIDAVAGQELLLAENETQYVSLISNLFHGTQKDLGLAARKKMLARYGWDANLSKIDRILALPANTGDPQ